MGKEIDDMTPEELAIARGDYADESEIPELEAKADDKDEETPEAEADDRDDDAEEDSEAEAEEEAEDEDLESDEDEADADEADEDEDEAPAKAHMIPKSRYDSVAQRNKDLQAKLDAMESEHKTEEQKAEVSTKIDELNATIEDLDDQINEAMLDADSKLAKSLRKEQRAIERELFKMESADTAEQATSGMREQMRLDMVIDQLQTDYPSLNPDESNDAFDQILVNEIQDLRSGYEATGRYTPAQALLKAVNMIIRDEPAPAKLAEEADSEEKSKPKPDNKRKRKAVEKAVDAARKQPPSIGATGEDSDQSGIKTDIDPSKLSEEDYDSLPEATKKRLRGDFLH